MKRKTQTSKTNVASARLPLPLWVLLIILWTPLFVAAEEPLQPPSYGIYLQQEDSLLRLPYQQARRVAAGEMGYVMGVMHRTRVFLVGERSVVRTSDRIPTLTFYGADPAEFYSLVKLRRKDGVREFHYSVYGMGGGAQVVEEYRVEFRSEKVGEDLYRMIPSQGLEPGEYGIVLGNSICSFGVDD